jgi:C4-dicarboxylate transporter DctQ subunit
MLQGEGTLKVFSKISHFSNKIAAIEKMINTIIFLLMLMIMFAQVLSRYIINYPLNWSEECVRYMFVVTTYLGSAIAVKQAVHIEINIWPAILPKIPNNYIKTILDRVIPVVADVVSLIFIVFVFWMLFDLSKKSFQFGQISPSLGIPMYLLYVSILFSLGLMIFHFAVRVLEKLRLLLPEEK